MITAQIELFRDAIEEAKPFLPVHWEEVAIFKDQMPLDPDYGAYQAIEDAGELVVATLREAGRLIGYFSVYLCKNLHYQSTRTAKMDILYIDPERRGFGNGRMLVECMKAELKRRGVKMWHVGSKNHKSIEWLFLSLGFEPTEMQLSIWLGD